MSTPLLTIAVMSFLACFLGVLGFVTLYESRRDGKGWQARVRGHSQDARREPGSTTTGLGYFRDRLIGVLERVGQANQNKRKEAEVSALRRSLTSAGYRKESAPAIFTGFKLLLALLVPACLLLVPIPALDHAPTFHRMFAYVLAAAIGLYGPELWLSQVVKKRKQKIINAFPDALDLLVVCVEAGLGLDAAVGRVGKELLLAHPELSDEFSLLALELRAGLPRAQALNNLGRRVDIDEVKNLVALLIQTDRFGTSIGQALRVHSDAMRTDRALRAEEMAAKLPVKMLFPLMFFIFPVLFIVILGPAIIQGMRILLPALQT
ncbi:MAG TPA: type II secretion system F family protein [Candidatus Binatia bacterium]|nr:type II secretion system F family protein [Candidatus Binatia bacterium]